MHKSAHRVPYHEYPRAIRKRALAFVFDSLKFSDFETAQVLRDSYFMNLKLLMDYAHEKRIDELDYILDIRDIFIKSGTAHER